jgi:4-amino-4-deoxy-L-arabinose transferase-like glycosyltransferase
MIKKHAAYIALWCNILISFTIKLAFILYYKNQLTLSSDDLNYIKSAVVLLQKGIFTFHNFNEPTVFVMPLFPMFLASVFKVFGWGATGLQAVRILQAILSCLTVLIAFLLAREFFNSKIAVITTFLVAYYIPNITTVGYILTETLFTFLLSLLIYLSLLFLKVPDRKRSFLLGIVWVLTTLCRPTTAFYPLLLFAYALLHNKIRFSYAIKMGLVMSLAFVLCMSPWWIRNYLEYGEFIPLAASSGNPMLQGTYVGYQQTPENTSYYELGRNALETDKIEVKVAKERIRQGLQNNFLGYVKWYTLGKTGYFWNSVFYWQEYAGIDAMIVLKMHYVILLGLPGILLLAAYSLVCRIQAGSFTVGKQNAQVKDTGMRYHFSQYLLSVFVILYFNFVHCVYMAFDRYAYPLLPMLSIFAAFFLDQSFAFLYRLLLLTRKRLGKILLLP